MIVLDRPTLGASMLAGCVVTESDRAPFPVRIARRHLCALGASRSDSLAGQPERSDLLVAPASGRRSDARRCSLAAWTDTRFDDEGACEAMVQAISGLMAVNGRDRGGPRRLGLDVASTAAGILAASGILAALVAQARGGGSVRTVETSVLHGALTFLRHHVAIATCGKRLPVDCNPSVADEDRGALPTPPFPTADGGSVELEVLSADAWRAFWLQMGVAGADADSAWLPFALRYLSGTCRLPSCFATATSRRTGQELVRIARSCGLSAVLVRGYDDLLQDVAGGRVFDGVPELDSPWTVRPGAPLARADAACTEMGELPCATSPDELPLAGLRVVEATTRLQGPLATRLLQHLGAVVIRVEPVGGDIGRTAPGGAFRAAYSAYNHGKQLIELDYKESGGRADLLELVSTADVFLHNWPDGRAERLGLDATSLLAVNPALVTTHASGWGSGHPGRGSITGDFLVQAHTACGEGLNPLGAPPLPSRLTIVDVLGGLIACEGTLAGLYHRHTRGSGAAVETSLLSAALTLQSEILSALAHGLESGRLHGRLIGSPLFEPIQTGEGHLVIAADRPDLVDRAMDVLGLPFDELADERRLVARLGSKSAEEWVSDLDEAGVPATAALTDLSTLATDDRAADCIERVDPGHIVPAQPWRFTA